MNVERARSRPVQDSWADNACFGRGRANEAGLHLESYLSAESESLVATFEPEQSYTAGYPTMAFGGLIASLIDCHCLWTAMTFAYVEADRPLLSEPLLMYVTGELTTRFLKPTPVEKSLELEAQVDGEIGDRIDLTCTVRSDETVTARGEQTAVRPSDPAPIESVPRDLHHRVTSPSLEG